MNNSKSSFITVSIIPIECSPVVLNSKINIIPTTPVVKYLSLTFDKCLIWAQHQKNKRKSFNSRLHLLRPLLSSKLAVDITLLIYKVIIRPVWSHSRYELPSNAQI